MALDEIQRLNPDVDPNALQTGPAAQARPVSRVARSSRAASLAAARCAARVRLRGARRRAGAVPAAAIALRAVGRRLRGLDRPPGVRPRRRAAAPDRQHDEDDDRAADAPPSVALDRICTAPPYAAGAARDADRPARRRAHARARPAARAAAAERERRGRHARRLRGRLARGVRRAHERARAPARPAPHALRDADRARRPGNYSTAADLVRLAIAAARGPVPAPDDGPAQRRRCAAATASRTVVNRNALVQQRAVGRRRQDRPHERGRLHPRGLGHAATASTFVAAVLGDPSEARARRRRARAAEWAFASYRVATPVERGAVYARPAVKHRPDERIDVVAARDGARAAAPRRARAARDRRAERARGPAAARRRRRQRDGARERARDRARAARDARARCRRWGCSSRLGGRSTAPVA